MLGKGAGCEQFLLPAGQAGFTLNIYEHGVTGGGGGGSSLPYKASLV
jgi:hypothetical protein